MEGFIYKLIISGISSDPTSIGPTLDSIPRLSRPFSFPSDALELLRHCKRGSRPTFIGTSRVANATFAASAYALSVADSGAWIRGAFFPTTAVADIQITPTFPHTRSAGLAAYCAASWPAERRRELLRLRWSPARRRGLRCRRRALLFFFLPRKF